jgi:hypothetical protein
MIIKEGILKIYFVLVHKFKNRLLIVASKIKYVNFELVSTIDLPYYLSICGNMPF